MAHPIVERIRNLFRGKPSPFSATVPRSLRESIEGPILPKESGAIHMPAPEVPPEGVDLAALWEEPQDPSSLAMIASMASAIGVGILIIMKMMGK